MKATSAATKRTTTYCLRVYVVEGYELIQNFIILHFIPTKKIDFIGENL